MSQPDIKPDTRLESLKTWKDNLLDGSGVLRNEIHSFVESMASIIAVAMVAFIGVCVSMAFLITGEHWKLYWRYNLARVLDLVPAVGNSTMWGFSGKAGTLTPSEFVASFHHAYHELFMFTSVVVVGLSAVVFGGIAYLVQKLYVAKGKSLQNKYLRGQALISKDELEAAVRTENAILEERAAASALEKDEPVPEFKSFTLCGVQLPHDTLQRNVFLAGGMGSGKSNAIMDLIDQMCAWFMTLAIYDKVGAMTVKYYREGIDVIFNPFDARCPGWNIFKEISMTYGFPQISEDLMMVDKDADKGSGKFFNDSARMLNEDIMVRVYMDCKARGTEPTTEAYTKVLFEYTIDEKYDFLRGMPSAELISPEAKSRGDIHNTLISALRVLRYVKSGDFSIRDFVRQGGDRRLFLLSKEEVHAPSAPLLAMAASILYKEMMNGDEVSYPKYGVILDELSSIKKLPILNEACTEARKYGVATVIGAQNISQFYDMYGKDRATTILSNMGHVVMLRVNEAETQELYSKAIGVGEYDELTKGLSWGPEDNKDGKNINKARKEIRAVLPSELGLLADNTGYLKVAGAYKVAKVAYSWRKRVDIAVKWVPRSDLSLAAYDTEIEKLRSKIVAEERLAEIVRKSDDATVLDANGWVFRATHEVMGKCDYKSRTIYLPVNVLNSGTPGLVAYGFAHEMAHAFAGPKAGHGKVFVEKLTKLCPSEYLGYAADYTGEAQAGEVRTAGPETASAEPTEPASLPWTGEDPTLDDAPDGQVLDGSFFDSALSLISSTAESTPIESVADDQGFEDSAEAANTSKPIEESADTPAAPRRRPRVH